MFSETASQGWFSRLGGSLKNILFGLLLLIAAAVLLFWNEGRAVKTWKALKEGAGAIVSVPAQKLDAANEGRLVHVSGPLSYPGKLTDPAFHLSVPALRLKRKVQMLQWHEEASTTTRKKLGGGTETMTTYSYKLAWSPKLVDSSRFKQPSGHENPTAMPIEPASWVARDARIGAFTIPASLAASLGREEPVTLDKSNRPDISIAGRGRMGAGDAIYFGSLFHDRPGDLRVRFFAARPLEASIIGMQKGTSLAPYKASNGRKIFMSRPALVPATEMFAGAERENKLLTWLLRGLGTFMLFIAFGMILNILRVIADIVPVFGSVVGAGATVISALLAVALAFLVIAAAWLFFRPLLSLGLLAGSLGIAWLVRARLKKAPAVTDPA